jgi:hypothetical protein
MVIKNGCKEKQSTTMYKSSRYPLIKDGLGYNRYDGKANGRNMINGVPCVKFNKGVALDGRINKVNNVTTSPSTLAKNKTNNKKQVDAPSNKHPSHEVMLVIICVVGARMARLF